MQFYLGRNKVFSARSSLIFCLLRSSKVRNNKVPSFRLWFEDSASSGFAPTASTFPVISALLFEQCILCRWPDFLNPFFLFHFRLSALWLRILLSHSLLIFSTHESFFLSISGNFNCMTENAYFQPVTVYFQIKRRPFCSG